MSEELHLGLHRMLGNPLYHCSEYTSEISVYLFETAF